MDNEDLVGPGHAHPPDPPGGLAGLKAVTEAPIARLKSFAQFQFVFRTFDIASV